MAVLLTVPLVKRNYWPVFIFDIGKLTNNNNILSNSPQSAGAVAGRAGFFRSRLTTFRSGRGSVFGPLEETLARTKFRRCPGPFGAHFFSRREGWSCASSVPSNPNSPVSTH
jgi:hypothetical protein